MPSCLTTAGLIIIELGEKICEMSLCLTRDIVVWAGGALCSEETIKEFFTEGPGAVCDLISLYFQER